MDYIIYGTITFVSILFVIGALQIFLTLSMDYTKKLLNLVAIKK